MTQPSGGEALRIYEKTLACVHCGLCLPACPAYENAPRESLAPRGQVFNARALLEGRLPPSDGLAEDLYECLACRGCESVCPAGVEVGAIVEGVRGLLDEEAVEPRRVRVLKRFALGVVVARPLVLGAAMWLLRFTGSIGLRRLVQPVLARLAPKLAARERLLPEVPARERFPARVLPNGEACGTVALFLGCVAPHLRPETSRAAIEALTRNGWEVVIPKAQGCCGALHLHAGLPDLARGLARRNLAAFADDLPVVTTAAGCGAALSEYGELLEADRPAENFSRRVTDVSAFLSEHGCRPPAAGPREMPLRVVYDAPCHLFHAQQVREEPLRILRSLPGVELVTVRDPERCCGSAGIYNVTRHDTSMAVLDRKMANIAPTDPDLIATGNIGCQLQLAEGARRAGLAAEVAHPVELLADAYRREEEA
ncbi:MAG: (Fe-S)-binding protein [Acidobacteriota bacterium]|nr:(Fe-S)-binding protein [Acidobacteriota bacterium]